MQPSRELAQPGAPVATGRYRYFLLGVLLLVLAFNFVDRLALGLVLQQIKVDLHLTDTQLGFLTGTAFAVFYSLMGLPIARWADRGNRVALISLTTALWSVAVALCGLAQSFWHLLLIRVGVAVGEAGCIPPAHSLIGDFFTREERPRAVSIYMLGAPLSSVIGYFLAGWLNELYGWRVMFMVLGLPGVALAALVWFTLREPRRSRRLAPPQPSMRTVCATLWRSLTFRHLVLCFAITHFFGYGILQWQPAFFIRSFGMNTGELGSWFALIYGCGGLLGTYWGGTLASRYATNNEALQLRAMAIAYGSFGLISVAIYTSSSVHVAFALIGLSTIGSSMAVGPMFATIQSLVPQNMRAVSIAALYLLANLIGLGLGPLATGALSDALRPFAGEESLRYALLALCPGYLWAAWHLWRSSRTVIRDQQTGTL
jgi:predicted MFS family arabinose efflux permease